MSSRDRGGSEGDKKWGCTPCPAVLESGEDLALGSAGTASPRLEQNQQIQGADGSFHLVCVLGKAFFPQMQNQWFFKMTREPANGCLFQLSKHTGWKGDLVVKKTCCSSRVPVLIHSITQGSSKPSVPQDSGDPTPSSCICGHLHTRGTHVRVHTWAHSHTHTNKNIFLKYSDEVE